MSHECCISGRLNLAIADTGVLAGVARSMSPTVVAEITKPRQNSVKNDSSEREELSGMSLKPDILSKHEVNLLVATHLDRCFTEAMAYGLNLDADQGVQ